MARPPEADIDDMEGFLGLLEHARLELVEAVMANNTERYDEADLQKLALHGAAVQSVKDAIAFRKKFDSM
ncbi:hypothetical protein FHP25_13270 [Vineibacter terrae]|uniref:Uncharacterized protein n=1 Tax=Vineibacter terrae TaxID=2586908 RepID=A0A5C8PMJ3_9HYPH|nr:hypothetical protein [Vineibacter terrae]TXL75620.1 hypothetical protein FHP25_13270 [Vineibacter terrae]